LNTPTLKQALKANMHKTAVIGWDIGGAHLKAVQVDSTGQVLAVEQIYCPLWRGLHELDRAFDGILSRLQAPQHAVTMTGELADFFINRHDGVQHIAAFAQQKLGDKVQFYAAKNGFIPLQKVATHTVNIASMNWFASVQLLATHLPQALFVDVGSTTTDIAIINQHHAQVQGFNDAARMQADELVYTGVVRTPLMALAQKIEFNGKLTHVAAEHFATTADIYMLTGDLSAEKNMSETADGAEKTIDASARRIARMVGMDSADADLTAWVALANAFKQDQLNQVRLAVSHQLARINPMEKLTLVACGAGEFLAREIAQQLGLHFLSVTDFIEAENIETQNNAAVCFPAFAVAQLGLMNLSHSERVVTC
jgi:probable H4MPT-linked C1 transfer pathway protein